MFLNQARTRRKVRHFHSILARQLCLKWLLRLLVCQGFWSWILEPRLADFLEKHLQVTHHMAKLCFPGFQRQLCHFKAGK